MLDQAGPEWRIHQPSCLVVTIRHQGVGALRTSILLSVIGDAKHYKEERKLASYFGIVPRVHSPGLLFGRKHAMKNTKVRLE